jgi:hypothetical protein
MVCPQAHSFTALLSSCAGDQWRLVSEGIHTHALPAGANFPDEEGFRIRLSVYPALADDLLRGSVPIIVAAGCPFKIIANTALLELLCSRNFSRDSATDFMTIYPPSDEILTELTAKLRDIIDQVKSSHVPIPLAETSSRAALTPDNPWPGLDFYLPGEHSFFSGREDAQLDLAQRIERGPVTVVRGPSGAGKTSLLRAGLQPFFERASLIPVYLNLQRAGGIHPLQQVRDAVNRVLREHQIDGTPFGEGQSLREYFSQQEPGWAAADKKPVVPVLVFDHLEDIFTSADGEPAAARPWEVFWTQFANLLGNRSPQTIGQPNLSNAGAERLGCKVVISLRQDYLPQFLAVGGQVQSIDRSQFSLKPFDGRQAVQAVLGPGRHVLDPAAQDALAGQIVRRVAREAGPSSDSPSANGDANESLDGLRIEPALLSFFCQQLNEARKRSAQSETGANFITTKLVEAESERILEDFFRIRAIARIAAPVTKPQAAHQKEHQTQEEAAPLASRPAPFEEKSLPEPKEVEEMKTPVLAAVAEDPSKESLPVQPPPPVPVVMEQQDTAEAEPPAPAPQQDTAEAAPPAPAPRFSPKEPMPVHSEGHLARRLRILAYGVGLLLTSFLAVLVVLYLQEIQKQQTQVELEEYISNLAAAKKTFKSANKKLTLAESDLAVKESSIQALAKKSREEEAEAENARQENLKLVGEQTNYESRILQLNRDKAQAEARVAQWSGLVNDLTNQIAGLSKETAELQVRNAVLAVTNKGGVTNLSESQPARPNPGKEGPAAAAMESFPVKLPASAMTSSRRQVDVLLTNGISLSSEDGIRFKPLRPRDVLFEGAIVRTGPASWSDFFIRRTGTTVRLAPESEVRIAKLSEESENGVPVMDTWLELRRGRIFTVVRALAPGSTLEISDAAGQSVIEGGGLGCYMITAPGPASGDKLSLTPLRVISQIGTSVIAPGQGYNARDGAALSLVPSSWETMLIQLDELEAETDKAISEPQHPASSTTQK